VVCSDYKLTGLIDFRIITGNNFLFVRNVHVYIVA
jgi:hypothetical protein